MQSESERKRQEYYVFQSNYYGLKNIAQKFADLAPAEEILNEIKTQNIDVNSYVTTFGYGFVPIIYQSTCSPKYESVFIYLINHGANPNLLPDADCVNDILFVCHEKYLKTLIKLKCQLQPTEVHRQILAKLRYGDIRRLKLLIKYRVLKLEQISELTKSDELAFDIISGLIEQVMHICVNCGEKPAIDCVLKRHYDTLEFMIKHGLKITVTSQRKRVHTLHEPSATAGSVSLIQYATDYYLADIVSLLLKNGCSPVPVIFHEKMDPQLVAILRHLYNDRNYARLCEMGSPSPLPLCGDAM